MSSKSGEAPSATRLKREVWWFIAAAAGLLAGAAGLLQPPRADPFQVVTPWTSSDWWRHPIERNAFTRLAAVSGGLNHVFALPDGKNVWAVGNGGLIVHSADGGKTWEQQSNIQLSASVSTGATPGTRTPAPGAAPQTPAQPAPAPPSEERQPAPQKKSLLFDMVPSAHAAQPPTAKDGTSTLTRAKSPAQQRAMPSDAANNPAHSQSLAQQQDYSEPPPGAAQSSRETVPPASAKQGQTLKESANGSPADANAAYEPPPVQPKKSTPVSPATIDLHAIHFIDASHGWAVGAPFSPPATAAKPGRRRPAARRCGLAACTSSTPAAAGRWGGEAPSSPPATAARPGRRRPATRRRCLAACTSATPATAGRRGIRAPFSPPATAAGNR